MNTNTITTAEAAATAGVTIPTIRTWCRIGAIAATKRAGRWVIDAASLAHRIAIGQLKSRKPKPVVYSVETMTAIGGREWIRGDKHRVYLNDWAPFAGLEVSYYKSGNVSGATLGGEPIANNRAARLLGTVRSVYFDVTDGRLYVQHHGADAVEVRYLDGTRDTVNLVARIFAGVRAAVAAL